MAPRSKKPGNSRERDPRFADEAARYDNPIASREFFLATLAKAGVPLSYILIGRKAQPAAGR